MIEVRGVTKVYRMGEEKVAALAGVDLTIARGEHAAVIGPSGSGKSSLMNILGGLDRPTEGHYRFAGDDVGAFSDDQLAEFRNRRIGFVFQSFQLVSHLTVLENVELPLFYARCGRSERRARAVELLEKVGLKDRLHHRPTQLSSGERQRTAIARALANEPALVLADEPTGNLDTSTGREILELFHRIHRAGGTLVLITHDPSIAEQAPRRVALRDGRVESDSGRLPPVERIPVPA